MIKVNKSNELLNKIRDLDTSDENFSSKFNEIRKDINLNIEEFSPKEFLEYIYILRSKNIDTNNSNKKAIIKSILLSFDAKLSVLENEKYNNKYKINILIPITSALWQESKCIDFYEFKRQNGESQEQLLERIRDIFRNLETFIDSENKEINTKLANEFLKEKKKVKSKEDLEKAKQNKSVIVIREYKNRLNQLVNDILTKYEKDGKDVFDSFEDIYTFVENKIEKTTRFKPILGANFIQKMSELDTKRPKKETHNGIVKNAFSTDGFTVIVDELYNFDTFTQKIFDIYLIAFTSQNHYRCASENINSVVNPGLEEIMKLLGTPNTKASKDYIRKKTMKSLNIIQSSGVIISTKIDGKEEKMKYTCCSARGEENKLILVFSPVISEYFIKSPIMQYPINAFKYKNPVAIKLVKKLSNHFGNYNNISKKTNAILSVSSLLKSCSSAIPTYEEVKRTDRRVEKRIIAPFEKGLDYLRENDFLTRWEYCNTKKQQLTTEQLSKQLTYKDFEERYISFEIKDFPDQTERLENKKIQKAIDKKSKNEKSGVIRQQKRSHQTAKAE